jgi:uncharacterized protein YggE
MRWIVIGLTMALAASAPLAATAQPPVTTQPLARGEVLLEVNALGLVTTRADRATMTFTVGGTAPDQAAARAEAERELRELRALLHGMGVTEADIHAQPITSYENDAMATMNAMDMAVDMNATMTDETTMTVPAGASATVEIVIRNVDNVPAIQSALAQRGYVMLGAATYAVTDDTRARGQARAQALQKARADAEAYAASLNMRVARVVRVTERLGLDLLSMAASESQVIARIFSPAAMRGSMEPDVPTMVVVGVDFALAPR